MRLCLKMQHFAGSENEPEQDMDMKTLEVDEVGTSTWSVWTTVLWSFIGIAVVICGIIGVGCFIWWKSQL